MVRPDMTVMADWELKNPFSIYLSEEGVIVWN